MSPVDRLMPESGHLTVDDVDRWLDDREADLVDKLDEAITAIIEPRIIAYAATLTAAGDPSTLDGAAPEWREVVDNVIIADLTETYLATALVAYQTSPARGLVDEAEWVEVVNQRAVEYQEAATNRIVGASTQMWTDVRDRVTANLLDGMEIDALRREVEATTQFARGRSEAIARTETLGAYNGGDWAAMKGLGEFGPTHKGWLATRDARTRPSHAEANGQVVGIDEPFQVGGVEMMRPHAPGAPAGEVVNCRCVMLSYWPGDTLPDGSTVDGETPTPSSAVELSDGRRVPIETLDYETGLATPGADQLTPELRAEIADGLDVVQARYPGAPLPNRVLFDPESGAVANAGANGLNVSPHFADPEFWERAAAEQWAFAAPSRSPKWTTVHESGHLMERNLDRELSDELFRLLDEPVTVDLPTGPVTVPRWQAGDGSAPSVYAQESRYEYVAEAVVDVLANGAKAKPGSVLVDEVMRRAYGGG